MPAMITPDHHAASSRASMPRATSSSASPAMLPRKCAASTSTSGTCMASRAVAASVAGVAPEISSMTPTMNVNVASSSGDTSLTARATGAATPRRSSYTLSRISALASGRM